MKKRKRYLLLPSAMIIVVSAALGLQYHLSVDPELSQLTLENIEALSSPEDAIICDKKNGQCWKQSFDLKVCGEHFYYECFFSGKMADHCYEPC